YPVQEYIYVTLTDHIYLSYQNLNKGTYENTKLPDMRKDYPVEQKIGENALQLIREKLGIDFPQEEVSRIALHFINAKGTSVSGETDERIEKAIIDLVQHELAQSGIKRTNSNKNYYDRLMIHLNYFLERLLSDEGVQDSFSLNFEANLKQDYPAAYQIGNRIYELIGSQLGKTLNENERIYFTIHIQRLL
ncbi:MAG: PRD domain-containing protein, partial [Enterococcus sp.]|nr:PRD domain-containing protein [Enterococcus sp.]